MHAMPYGKSELAALSDYLHAQRDLETVKLIGKELYSRGIAEFEKLQKEIL